MKSVTNTDDADGCVCSQPHRIKPPLNLSYRVRRFMFCNQPNLLEVKNIKLKPFSVALTSVFWNQSYPFGAEKFRQSV